MLGTVGARAQRFFQVEAFRLAAKLRDVVG